MKKTFMFLSTLCFFALVGASLAAFHSQEYKEAKADPSAAFRYEMGSSAIIKSFATAFTTKQSEEGGSFNSATVSVTAENGAFTYGIAHGNLYGGTFTMFDTLSNNKFYDATHESDTKSYASTFGNNYGNPYIFTGHLDGFVFWFTANETLTFEMPAITLTPNAAGGTNGMFKNLYAKVFVKDNGSSSFSQKSAFQFANNDSAQTIPAFVRRVINEGDTVCFELRRAYNDASSTTYSIQGTSLPFILSNYYAHAKAFEDNYMYMSDNNFDTAEYVGLCNSEDGLGGTPYTRARDAFLALDNNVKDYFCSDSNFVDAYARLLAWAAANNATYNEGTHTFGTHVNTFKTLDESITDNSTIVIVAISVLSISVFVTFLFIRRKQD